MTPSLLALIEERYPDLAFFLRFPPENGSALLDGNLQAVDLSGMDTLYCFGLSPQVMQWKSWVEEARDHVMILLDDRWERVVAFLESPAAFDILKHPQIHLHFIPDSAAWKNKIEELAESFPTSRLICTRLNSISRSFFKKYSEQLLRSSGALSALYSDVLHGHLLSQHLLSNFPRLLQGFDPNTWQGAFDGIPALICGAGPSLNESLPWIRKQRDQMLILAGGSAISALLEAGIQPHLALALDPNQEEQLRLKSIEALQAPLLCSPRLESSVVRRFKGQLGYLYSATGGIQEEWLRRELGFPLHPPIGHDLGREAFSVTTLALAFAHFLGCSSLILTGVDLAYTGGKRYASGVVATDEKVTGDCLDRPLWRKGKNGRRLRTQWKWVMEADVLEQFAKTHPGPSYFDQTKEGLSLPSYMRTPPKLPSYSLHLEEKIQSKIEKSRYELATSWPKTLAKLSESLQHCGSLIEEWNRTASKGMRARIECDLVEQPAYSCFLEGVDAALDRVLSRQFIEQEERERAKWKALEEHLRLRLLPLI